MMQSTIENRIRAELSPTHLHIESDGSHYKIIVVSESFADQRRLQREQRLNALLQDLIASGDIHAVSYVLRTPEEYEKDSRFGTL